MSDDKPTTWTTGITQIEPNQVRLRGYDIGELMGPVSFGSAVYLILRGELPDEKVGRLMEAILVSSIDHGATPPSALAARTAASTGASLGASVAAGLLAINRYHGGAIEECAHQLAHIVRRCDETGDSLDNAAKAVLDELKADAQRMAGFGHRIHTNDPRTKRLFDLGVEAGVDGRHMEAARAVHRVFVSTGKNLSMNVDGAIAAVLADLGFEPSVMNGLFMIARLPGLVAHVVEEQTRERPMRKIDPINHAYDGPPPRSLTPNH
ncbi:MAG: citryl-CoA lyase [Planctomycetes bacterium]|nr:citryl-CoA lyase [Planctomycetota bacterium]